MLRSCLERLQQEAGRVKDVKEAVATALEDWDAEKEKVVAAGGDPETISADNYWAPFRIALQPTNHLKLREAALDSLQKLIARKLLRGALPIDTVGAASQLPRRRSSIALENDLSNLDITSPGLSHNGADGYFTGAGPNGLPQDIPPPVHSPRASTVSGDESISLPPPQYPYPAFLIDEIVHTVCTSFTSVQSDEPVHLQVLKVLLTIVTSTVCEIHEVTLLKVVQTCFNIHQQTRNQTHKMTAKASLTQMINLVFSRMERYAEVLARSLETGSLFELEKLTGPEGSTPTVGLRVLQNGSARNDGSHVEPSTAPTKEETIAPAKASADEPKPHVHVEEAESGGKETGSDSANGDPQPPEDGTAVVDQGPNQFNISDDSAPQAVTGEAGTPTARESLAPLDEQTTSPTRAHKRVISMTDEDPGITPPDHPSSPSEPTGLHYGSPGLTSGNNPYDPTVAHYNELLRKDVFLVFRHLCRLSIQTDNLSRSDNSFSATTPPASGSSLPMDEISQQATRTRILALELILSVLNNSGPVLQTDDLYMVLVRHNLTLSISRNGITTNPMLFELSLSIFLMVIRFFRGRLKTEVEVLLNTIYLGILEMGNSTYKQKSMVLQGLLKICENPQTLVDIYLNYDCDLTAVSIFERIVSTCGRIAQGRDSSQAPAASISSGLMSYAVSAAGLDSKEQLIRAQERRLKLRGLCCLVAIVNSLVDWSAEVAPVGGKGKKAIGSEGVTGGSGGRDSIVVGEEIKEAEGGVVGKRSLETTKSANSSVETTTKTFLDALAPTNQANPVMVIKHPLHSVVMDHHGPYNLPNSSTGSLNSTPGAAANAEDDPSQIESMASRKQLLRNAVKQFNMKPSKGIKMLIEHGFITNDAQSIAEFLRSASGLTKASIGEYLGEGDAFNIQVMHAFIDSIDFADQTFVEALRAFLQTFRLPGEAQKIDRIMEKFADRYCETNPGVFTKADTAYTLAFSVIMLNTDQHSSQIKHRMDLAAFLKNNRGIDDTDLTDEFLGAIFEDIRENEIIMEEEHAGNLAQMAVGWGAGDLNDRQRMELYRREIGQVQKKSQMLMQGGSGGATAGAAAGKIAQPFRTAQMAELARPMFGMASWPLMAVFSLLFEGIGDDEENEALVSGDGGAAAKPVVEPKVADLCLQGFGGSIRIASIFRMETERDAFVSSLAKLTGLSHVQDIRPKNIKAIKALIGIANMLGEYLEGSWLQVLKAVSLMERLQLIANRNSMEGRRSGEGSGRLSIVDRSSLDAGSGSPAPVARGSSVTGLKMEELAAQARLNPTLEKLVNEFQNQTTVVAIDRIFTNTVNLSATAIIHFFRSLCRVSMEEVGLDPNTPAGAPPVFVGGSSSPRMYLLQKIVEIAHYNIHRIRFEWTQVWRLLRPHFDAVGLHPSLTVATFAVDSLRQLSMKFLEREELGHYNSQGEFLKSFEWIMRWTTRWEIKELILQSLSQMIAARSRSIRSGWKSIFGVLTRAAIPSGTAQNDSSLERHGDEEEDDHDRLVRASVAVVQGVFRDNFDAVLNAGAFVDYVACLAEFALLEGHGQTHDEVVIGSVQLLQFCAKFLVQLGEDEAEGLVKGTGNDVNGETGEPTPPAAVTVPVGEAGSATTPHPLTAQRSGSVPYLLPSGIVSEDQFYLKWFPILSAFSRVIIGSKSAAVRTRATDALFDTLRDAGHLFESKYWMKIFGSVVAPIFEDLRDPMELNGNKKEDSSAVWIHGLRLLIDLTSSFFDKLVGDGGEVMRGVLDLMTGMLERKDEKLATSGGICLQQFLKTNVGKFEKAKCWDLITDSLERSFRVTMPAELLCCEYGADKGAGNTSPISTSSVGAGGSLNDKTVPVPLEEVVGIGVRAAQEVGKQVTLDTLDFQHTIIKCVTHLELVQNVAEIALMRILDARKPVSTESNSSQPNGNAFTNGVDETIALSVTSTTSPTTLSAKSSSTPRFALTITLVPPPHRGRWLKCLYNSYAVARAFNADYDLRYAIYRRGLVPQMPHLVKQETVSVATYLRVLFAVYRAQGDSEGDGDMGVSSAGRGDTTDDPGTALARETLDVFERYVDFLVDQQKNARDIGLWSPVVVIIFKELLAMEGWWTTGGGRNVNDDSVSTSGCLGLKKHLPRYFRLGIKMMSVDRGEVRAALQEFMEQVGEKFLKVT
ncbi:Brefeldin A-inhibited guanine nucleotide-exchange protein 2 [Rhizophlyctis rosea]|uniref:Brefeldin A-inhibited guanine nucleotide-exchange protein 2 n=1 Tax=Rhizophlyctis rosea TaxID=64517 RepID=A0AAD5X9L2_9FUNG|nr:Brefeldin A-inhibited guanine nucleotide-exchange protein 2 [Rhizophlyctis rosea]